MRPFGKLALLFAALAAPGAQAQDPDGPPNWPYEEDIVRAEPVAIDLTSADEADVARYIMVRGAGDFVLSADGERVVYLSDVTGAPQLWSVARANGFPDQLTYGHGVDWFRISPDGGHILFGADDDGDERVAIYLLSVEDSTVREVLPRSSAFREFGSFSPDGERFVFATTGRNGTDFDIHIADATTGDTREIYRGKGGVFAADWQPNGHLVIVSKLRGEAANDLYLLNTETGNLDAILVPPEAAAHYAMAWAPGGAGFYLATNEGTDFADLAFYDVAHRQLNRVESPGYDIGDVDISDDGRYLAWTTIETGFSRLHVRDLSTGRNIALPDLPRGWLTCDFASAAPVLGIRINGPRSPGQIFVLNLNSGNLQLAVPADIPALDLAAMVVPEPVSFEARDGLTLTGLLYMPARSPDDAPPPVFIALHGGPSSYATPTYRPDIQYYVARGIAVFDFNYRGSTGQGRLFATLNDRERKVDEPLDVVDAVHWLQGSGLVDPARIAVGGGSYGGYLTNLLLGTYPDMFVAGVSRVGVSNWVTALEGASPSLKASDRIEFGDIDDPAVRAFFDRLSPINYTDRIRTPLMVLHGANDPRDPVAESDRFVEQIRAAGGNVTYLRFPDEGHGISHVVNRVYAYRHIADFLLEHFAMTQGGN